MKHALLLGFLLIGLAGCVASGSSRSGGNVAHVDPPDLPALERTLRDATAAWEDTPHVMGGTSRSGADCSGFVMRVFENRLDRSLPRSTRQQVSAGIEIGRDELRAGDLVLFRTGRKTRHVGIYLSENEFAHVSPSRGVTVSDMTTSYWQDAYWTARRVVRPTTGGTTSSTATSSPAPSQEAPYGW
jgi:cell wall-associated NlpC family hydrolase